MIATAACYGAAAPVKGSVPAGAGIPAPQPSGPPAAVPAASAAAAASGPPAPSAPPSNLRGSGPGFPAAGPWMAFYGTAAQMGSLARVARKFRIIDIDADPGDSGVGNFSNAQIRILKNGGANRVLSYLDIGSCERFRTYFSHAPPGIVPCGANRAAQLGAYQGYPDEVWMNPANPDYQKLILQYVAPRLAARGVDGFYLDNLEVVEHSDPSEEGWCSPECRQGGLDLVRSLRQLFPDHLIVMQNATSDVTRLGTSGGIPFPTFLDGIAHEEVYSPTPDVSAEQELVQWQSLHLSSRNGYPFFIGVEDYVGSCSSAALARSDYEKSRAHGFSPYASDASNSQKVVCFWGF